MQTQTRPLHLLLIATVASISYSGQEDVRNAEHARWLATHGKIPPEHLGEAIGAIDKKLAEVADAGADTNVGRIHAELQGARAGVTSQLDHYKKMLVQVGQRSFFDDEPRVAGRDVVAGRAARKTNGVRTSLL